MSNKLLCGKNVPRIGLGCMGMSEFYGKSDDQHSVNLLSEAFELGYRHFDTADMYGRGHNEKLLSTFLSKLSAEQRAEIVLASKVGIVRDPVKKYSLSFDNSYDYIKNSCEQSLKRLNVECIDLYYLHRLAPDQNLEEVLSVFSDLIKEGKIKSMGLCEVSAEVLEQANAIQRISAIQSEYSLWSRGVEEEVLPMCKKLNIPLVGFSPLGRGILTGEITKEVMSLAKEEEDLRTRLPRFSGENLDNNIKLIEEFGKVAASQHILKSQLSLAWLLAQSDLVHVIPGTRKSQYLRDNFSAQSIHLTDNVVEELSQLFVPSAIHGDRYPSAISPNIS